MPEFNPEMKLRRLAIDDKAIICNKFVWRSAEFIYMVNGERFCRINRELPERLLARVLFAITGDPGYQLAADREIKKKWSADRYARQIKEREEQRHPCMDCGQPCGKTSKRCTPCANAHKRQYPLSLNRKKPR